MKLFVCDHFPISYSTDSPHESSFSSIVFNSRSCWQDSRLPCDGSNGFTCPTIDETVIYSINFLVHQILSPPGQVSKIQWAAIVTNWTLSEVIAVTRYILSLEYPIAVEAKNVIVHRPMIQRVHFVKPINFLFRVHLFSFHVYFWTEFIFKQSRTPRPMGGAGWELPKW